MNPPPPSNRRVFLKRTALGLLGGAVGLGGYAWLIEPHWIEVVQRDLPIRFLPDALIGKTLVQISDLHIGPEVSDAYLRDAFKTISGFAPDILVVTGDFMTCKRDEELDHVCRVLEDLPPARLATIGILGNHDYTRSHRVTDVADRLTTRLTGLGLRMLRNASCDVQGLTISGADDLWSGRCDINRVTLKLDNDKANLFLSITQTRPTATFGKAIRAGFCAATRTAAKSSRRSCRRRSRPSPTALRRGRSRSLRRPQALHQPRPRRGEVSGALQRAAGDHGVHIATRHRVAAQVSSVSVSERGRPALCVHKAGGTPAFQTETLPESRVSKPPPAGSSKVEGDRRPRKGTDMATSR